MENNFKNQLRDNVKTFIELDNQIATLQQAIKERKKKKDELTNFILSSMKDNEIEQMNLNNDKLIYNTSQTIEPINKKFLYGKLYEYFNDSDKAEKLVEFIINGRKKTEKIKLTTISEKKKKNFELD